MICAHVQAGSSPLIRKTWKTIERPRPDISPLWAQHQDQEDHHRSCHGGLHSKTMQNHRIAGIWNTSIACRVLWELWPASNLQSSVWLRQTSPELHLVSLYVLTCKPFSYSRHDKSARGEQNASKTQNQQNQSRGLSSVIPSHTEKPTHFLTSFEGVQDPWPRTKQTEAERLNDYKQMQTIASGETTEQRNYFSPETC